MQREHIEHAVRDYVLREFLPMEGGDAITPTTPLITGGLLDSVNTIKLVSFLEDQYEVEFEAHEVSSDLLDTVEKIATTVQKKLSPA